MQHLSGAQRRKYLEEAEKNKSLDGYVMRKLTRKEPATKSDTGAAKSDTGGEMETRPEAREVGDSSMNVEEASQSFWHSEFDFRRYMAEQVPLANVDVEARVKAKFSDLVADFGSAALQILVMGQSMELKHETLEKQYKDASKDAEKWKHNVDELQGCLKDALKEKKSAEKDLNDTMEKIEAAEKERDEHKAEVARLQRDLAEAVESVEAGKRDLALYFDMGFKLATEQVLLFNPEANMDEIDPFKVIVDGKLVDEE